LNSRRRAWVFLLFGVLVCAFVFVTLLPSNDHWDRLARRLKAASNLREIGQAIRLYTSSFGDQYPDTFQTLLINEDITRPVFISASRSDTPAQGPTTRQTADELDAGGHDSNFYLGRGLTAPTVTPNTVIAYEMPASGQGGGKQLHALPVILGSDPFMSPPVILGSDPFMSPFMSPEIGEEGAVARLNFTPSRRLTRSITTAIIGTSAGPLSSRPASYR